MDTIPSVIDAAAMAGISPPPGLVPLVPAASEPTPGPQAGAAAPAVPEPVAMAAPVAEVPVFVGTRARSRVVQLDWPLLYAGVLYESITVVRPTTKQVGDYYERLVAQDGAGGLHFPLFYSTDGLAIPDVVLTSLDPDDDDRVMEVVSDFLPARLRRFLAPQPEASPRQDGALTEPMSSTS